MAEEGPGALLGNSEAAGKTQGKEERTVAVQLVASVHSALEQEAS